MHSLPSPLCLADLKKTLAVLLDNIMLRLGKLEAKVENIYNGTGANMSSSTSTATPSATNAEKVNVAGMYFSLLWFGKKYCPVKQRALSLETHPQFSSRVLTHLICCSVIYCMKLHCKRDSDAGFVLNSPVTKISHWNLPVMQSAPKHSIWPDHILGHDSNQTSVQAAWPNYWFVLIFPPTLRWWIRSSWERGDFFFPTFFLDSRQH